MVAFKNEYRVINNGDLSWENGLQIKFGIVNEPRPEDFRYLSPETKNLFVFTIDGYPFMSIAHRGVVRIAAMEWVQWFESGED